jgi:endonuclease/exonuclease/phosphatase family metal-dependent hydrolase
MRIGTLNLGMLHHFFSKVPHYFWRRNQMPLAAEKIFEEAKLDIIQLQELWRLKDVDFLEEHLGEKFVFLRSPLRWEDSLGLVTLVRRSAGLKLLDHQVHLYRNFLGLNRRAFHESITGYRRGFGMSLLEEPHGRRLRLVNTHLTPFEKNFELRRNQLSDMSRILERYKKPDELLVIGGDMNHSTAYLSESKKQKAERSIQDFLKRWDLVDHTRSLESFAPARNTIAEGCFWGNAGKPLCLDRIWIGPQNQFKLLSPAEIFAHNPIGKESDGSELHLSDHFGVKIEISPNVERQIVDPTRSVLHEHRQNYDTQ